MEEETRTIPQALDKGEIIVRNIKHRLQVAQPNSITWSRVSLTEIQDNVVTCIIDQLQDVFNGQRKLDVDHIGQPYVTIDCDEAGGYKNKSKVLKAILGECDERGRIIKQGLIHVTWQCRCTTPNGRSKMSSAGLLVTTCHDIEGTNKVFLNINPWAIPILLQGVLVTKGVEEGHVVKGKTIFVKDVSLSLNGKYTKRIYKILCSWRNRKEPFYNYDIPTFYEDLSIPKSYEANKLRTLVLERAKKEISESESDMIFDYELVCRHPQPNRKKAYDTIVFSYQTRDKEKKKQRAHSALWSDVDAMIWRAFGQPQDSSCAALTTALEKEGLLAQAKNKFLWYYDQEADGKWTNLKVNNSIKNWVRKTLSEYYQHNPDRGSIEVMRVIENIFGKSKK